MTLEVRLTTPDRLDEILSLPVDAVSIGQEGCLAKLPGPRELRAATARIRDAGLRAAVVLPAAWQRTSLRVLELGAVLAEEGPLTLTVNDLGTLVALADASPAGCELAAGLALFPGRPHHADEMPRGPLEAAVYEDGFLDELMALGVSVLEADSGAVVPERDTLRIRRLDGVTPVAWARSCPTARHRRLAPPDCHTACDTPTTLVATHRWQLGHGHREPIPVADRPHQVPLTVYGNAVYATSPVAAPPRGDVIVDARFHSPPALADRINALRARAAAAPLEETLHG